MSSSKFNPDPMGAYWGGPVPLAPQAGQLAPAWHQPTLKLSVVLKSTLSRTQQLPRSPVLSLTRCLVELVT